jgi:hypothetical protein
VTSGGFGTSNCSVPPSRAGLCLPSQFGGGFREFDDLQALLVSADFTRVRTVPLAVDAAYADTDEWWAAKWAHGTRRPLDAMPDAVPDALHATSVADVTACMASLRQPDGYHELMRVTGNVASKPADT